MRFPASEVKVIVAEKGMPEVSFIRHQVKSKKEKFINFSRRLYIRKYAVRVSRREVVSKQQFLHPFVSAHEIF